MSKHTPGPWRLDRSRGDVPPFDILARQGPLSVSPATAHSLSDAHLIVAAPDMLEALEGLVESLKSMSADALPGGIDFNIAVAAIAKATGGEHG